MFLKSRRAFYAFQLIPLLVFAFVYQDTARFEGMVIRIHWLSTVAIEEWNGAAWQVISKVSAANEGLPTYYSPLPPMREYGGYACPRLELGCQRAGEAELHLYAVIETTSLLQNFQWRCELPRDAWQGLEFEQVVTGEYWVSQHEIICSSLEFAE